MKMKVTPVPRELLKDVQYDLIDVKLFQRNVLDRSDFILLNSYNSNQEKVEMLMELMRGKNEEEQNNFLDVMKEDYNWLRDKFEIYLQKIRLDALLNATFASSTTQKESDNGVKQELISTEESDRSTSEPSKRKCPSSPDSTAMLARNIMPVVCKKENDCAEKENVILVRNNEKLDQTITPQMMTVVRRNYRVARRWSTLAHILGMTSIVHTLRMRMVMNGEDVDACILHLLEEWKGARPKEASLGRLIGALREEDFNDVADELEEKFSA